MKKNRMRLGEGEAGRFDQRKTMFSRARDREKSSPEILDMGAKFYGPPNLTGRTGYTQKDWALNMAGWYVERKFGRGTLDGNFGLFQWEPNAEEVSKMNRIPSEQKWIVSDARQMAENVKRAARILGASDAGICRVDRRWIYSYRFNALTVEHAPLEIPEEFGHAIVLIHEMNYELMKTSPTYTESAATGHGYSVMAFVAGSLAHYIRTLGYRAIPCGNDTALSIPMAIDAGLGELGRNGLLVTERFGPRVRISKVLTDLPLVPDKPVEFGVKRFCDTCKRCSEDCPGVAIPDDDPTQEGPSESNNPGIYKWYVHPEKCFAFWGRHRGGCGNCIRACPYNKPLGLVHELVRSATRYVPLFDPMWVKVDKWFGYGRKVTGGIFE